MKTVRFLAGLTAAILLAAGPAQSANTDDASWAPRASERLIKLPASYLKKAVEQDYARSPLAAAVNETRENMAVRVKAMEELRGAIDRAEGELRTELRHQFLAEKRAYLELLARNQKLRRQQAETKIRIYENLLSRMRQDKQGMTPQRVALIERQNAAHDRFESSIGKVDARLFRSSIASESRYARDYAKNVAAIEQLVAAINAHPMNEQPRLDGIALTREDYVRQLVGDNQATLAVLDQEQSILGFMAKLVALDATALSEAATGDDLSAPGATQAAEAGPTDAVEFFVTR